MSTAKVDLKALARLALWARLCCAPIRKPRLKWSGFNEAEWARLISLAAAVDRKTLLRLVAMEALTLMGFSLISAALVIALLFSTHLSLTTPMSMAIATAGACAVSAAALPVVYRIAFDFAARGGLRGTLVPQTGDAELVAKLRRQNAWVLASAIVGIVGFGFLFGLYSASLRPFLDQWSWLLYLLFALSLVDCAVRVWRKPAPITKS
jgi:hypothetical protein